MKDTVTSLLNRFKTRDLSVKEYAEQVISNVEIFSDLGAILEFDRDQLMIDADTADKRWKSDLQGPLEGLMLGVKDNIDTSSLVTTAGTSVFNSPAPCNAPVLKVLLDQGAIVAAKTNLHELAFGITSNNQSKGAVHNPLKYGYIAGGSSGGTAAAVAAGILPAGLGTDTGGSVRIPAALCGIAGFRPTTGRYLSGGIAPISRTRDTIGAMAHTVTDLALLDAAMARQNFSLGKRNIELLRIGVPRTVLWEDLDPGIAEGCQRILKTLSDAGVKLIEQDPADIWTDCQNASLPIALYETMRDLPEYAAYRGITFDSLFKGIQSTDVRSIIGSQLGEEKVPEAIYRESIDVLRPRMLSRWTEYFRKYDLDAVIFPTTPITARPIGEDENVLVNGNLQPTFPTYTRNTDHGSVMGVPGISLPGGLVDGLPYGIELEGLAGEDLALLEVAKAIEQILAPVSETKETL